MCLKPATLSGLPSKPARHAGALREEPRNRGYVVVLSGVGVRARIAMQARTCVQAITVMNVTMRVCRDALKG